MSLPPAKMVTDIVQTVAVSITLDIQTRIVIQHYRAMPQNGTATWTDVSA